MIKYLYKEGTEACINGPLMVAVDGRICGEIRKVDGGFSYFPKSQKTGGEVLATVTDVQNHLEE